MKVFYETDIDRGEPVAYVETDGTLVIKSKSGNYVYIDEDGECGCYTDFNPGYIVETLYKGDKITITF